MGSPGSIEDHDPIIILFDGVCNLCNGSVRFIIKRDQKAKFRFASLQSEFGKSQLLRFNLDPDLLHSIVVIEGDRAFERSEAALRIVKHLDGPWKALSIFRVLPKFIRDSLYNFIAANRYRIFGRRDSCMIPDVSLKNRFVE